jgi:acyl-coenzyme A thioesterase PaaI-like protein
LRDNTCFGCGLHNPDGLHIRVRRDPDGERLHAEFEPTNGMAGFPGIVHGGTIFTALDCLSTWVSTLLGPNRRAAWVLRSAQTVFHNPAPAGRPMTLTGWVAEHAGEWEPLTVAAEARREDGALCVEARFKVVPLRPAKLVAIADIERLPQNWEAFLASTD